MSGIQWTLGVVGAQDVERHVKSISKLLEEQDKRFAKGKKEVTRVQRDEQRMQLREFQKAEKEKERIARATAKSTESARKASEKAAAREAIASARKVALEQKKSSREVAEAQKKAAKDAARAQATIDRQAKARGKVVARSVSGSIGMFGKVGAAGLALAGGVSAVGALSDRLANQRVAGAIANNAVLGRTTDKSAGVVKAEVMSRAQEAQERYGLGSQMSVMGLEGGFIAKAGNYDQASKISKSLTELAVATGVAEDEFKSIGEAAGMIYTSLKNAGMTDDKARELTTQTMRTGAAQGAAGVLGLDDLASVGARIAAVANSLGGDSGTNMARTFALLNVGTSATGNVESATTGVERLVTDIAQNRKKFSAIGVKTQDKAGNTLDLQDIIINSAIKSKGSQDKLLSLYGAQSGRVAGGFFKQVRDMRAEGKTDAEMGEVLRGQLAGLNEIQMSEGQAKELAGNISQDTGAKLTAQVEKIKNALGEKLLPEVERMIPVLEKIAPKFVDLLGYMTRLLDWMANNPFSGIGAIVAGKIVADLAQAKIQETLQGQFGTAIKGIPFTALFGAALAGIAWGEIMAEMLDAFWDDKQGKDEGAIRGAQQALQGTDIEAKKKALGALDANIQTQLGDMGGFSGLTHEAFSTLSGEARTDSATFDESMAARKELQAQIRALEEKELEAKLRMIKATEDAAERLKKVAPEGGKVPRPPGSGTN